MLLSIAKAGKEISNLSGQFDYEKTKIVEQILGKYYNSGDENKSGFQSIWAFPRCNHHKPVD